MIAAIGIDQYIEDDSVVLRIGLGVVILLAGVHKIVEPAVWIPYLAPLFAVRWPISIKLTMVLFGLSELPVGIVLIADRYTTVAGTVVALSMIGTILNLAIAALQTGRFIDILIRDFAVLVLAISVTVQSMSTNKV